MAYFNGKGDDGTAKLFDSPKGERVSKTSPIFECLGQLDELNSLVGWCKAASGDIAIEERTMRSLLHEVQDHLFTIQAEVAGAQKSVPLSSVEHMGIFIGKVESLLPPVTSFLVAGGTELSSRLDIARAVSRRAERRLVTVHETGEREITASSRAYANRLSSLLYALTRFANHAEGVEENPPSYKA